MPRTKKGGRKTSKSSRKSVSSKAVWRRGNGDPSGTRGFSNSGAFSIFNSGSAFRQYNPFPTRKQCTLRYVEAGVVNALTCGTAGVGGTEHTYPLGSLFDPNLSLTGHQPYFFDQIAAVYQHYRVNKVTITIRAYDPSTPGTILGWQVDSWNGGAGTIAGVSPQTLLERPQTGRLQPNTTYDREETTIPRMSIARLEGLTESEYRANVEDYSALVTASPARSPYLRLACFNTEGNNSGGLSYHVEFLYDCEFWNRQVVALS